MATLVHASVIHQPTRPWTPLRIGVVWALATCAGPLAGAGSVLVWLRLFPPDIDNEGAAIFFGLVLILAMGVLALIGMAVAQAATLAWMRGTVGWQGKIAGAWVAATLGGAVAGVVLGGLMDYLRTRLPQPWPYGQTMYLSLAVSFAAFAAVVGGAQALVLRRHVPGAAWWVGATIAGWLVGGLAAAVVVFSPWLGARVFDLQQLLPFAPQWVQIGTVLLGVGAVTGGALAALVAPAQDPPRPRWRTALQVGGLTLALLAVLELLIVLGASLALHQGPSPLSLGAPAQITLRGDQGWVHSAAYSPDGKTIVTAGDDGTAKIWDAATGQELRTLTGHTGEVSSAAYSPDGKTIVTASEDQTAKIWDAATGQELRTLTGHATFLLSAAYSPDGKTIVTTGHADTGKIDTVKIWDAATGRELRTLTGHSKSVWSAAYSPDGKTIVTASWDRTMKIWDVATGQLLRTLSGSADAWSGVQSVAYSPDGRTIVAASDEENAQIWDVATGQVLHTLSGHELQVCSVAYSPDGTRIVTGGEDNTAKIWDAATGQLLWTLTGHGEFVNSAAYSPDGTRIVTASNDYTARIWPVKP